MNIIHKLNTQNNLCSIHFFWPINLEAEKNNLGIGIFLLAMLLKGSKHFNAHNLALKLESNAINFNFCRTANYLNLSLLFEKNSITEAINIFSEIFLNPKFDHQEIEKLKLEQVNAITARYDTISNICIDHFKQNIYGKDNYKSWLPLGDKTSLTKISQNDLIDFHQKYLLNFKPIISAVTPFKNFKFPDIFGKKKLTISPISDNLITPPKTENITKNFNQAYIMLGFKIPDIRDKEFLKIKLINSYLGGGMTSLLFDRIREQMGLVYEIGSTITTTADTNYFMIHLGLDKKNIKAALIAIDEEITNFKIKESDIKILKRRMKSTEIFKQETKGNQAFLLGLYEILGLEQNYSYQNLKNLDKIQTVNLERTAKTFFKQQKFVKTIIQ
ncbi:MAG: insulinase family protein [bacterium]|nr:insulinase family protein [bacterium]